MFYWLFIFLLISKIPQKFLSPKASDVEKSAVNEAVNAILITLSPIAPHITHSLWIQLGNKKSIVDEPFPVYDESVLVESEKLYPISFNGKTKFTLNLSLDLSDEEIEEILLNDDQTKKYLNNKKPKKVIIVKGKIINIVV